MISLVDVHIIAGKKERWIEECLASLSKEHVNIWFVPRIEGNTAKAREIGFRQGQADYVSFVDPDDRIVPGVFEKCLSAMNADQSLSGVYTDEILIDEQGKYLMDGWSKSTQLFPEQQLIADIFRGVHHLQVLRREYVEKCLPLKGKLMPEPILTSDIRQYGPLLHLPIVGYHWRIYKDQTFWCISDEELYEAKLACALMN